MERRACHHAQSTRPHTAVQALLRARVTDLSRTAGSRQRLDATWRGAALRHSRCPTASARARGCVRACVRACPRVPPTDTTPRYFQRPHVQPHTHRRELSAAPRMTRRPPEKRLKKPACRKARPQIAENSRATRNRGRVTDAGFYPNFRRCAVMRGRRIGAASPAQACGGAPRARVTECHESLGVWCAPHSRFGDAKWRHGMGHGLCMFIRESVCAEHAICGCCLYRRIPFREVVRCITYPTAMV